MSLVRTLALHPSDLVANFKRMRRVGAEWDIVLRKRRQPFGFLTADENAGVAPIHPKATPVILTTETEIET